jgi:tRNA pseudouridine32 synthase/23S rRNA pseudouridine746 synthase
MKPELQPAARDGIPASRVRVRPGEPATLLAFLQERFPHAADWEERLRAGEVLDADGQALSAESRCPAGSLLWYWRRTPAEARAPFDLVVLHQCEQLVVVDKPPFMSVTPGGRHLQETVLLRLQQQLALPQLSPLHRLDRDTRGVLAFAVRAETRGTYQLLWRDRAVLKVYEAVAPWNEALQFPLIARHRLVETEGPGYMQMQAVDGEANAETVVERLHELDATHVPGADPGARLALYRLTPHTGRKHQLRAQMAALGLPIVGDRIYPRLWPQASDDFGRPLQLLARSLQFIDPLDGRLHHFESRQHLFTEVKPS